jgi:hypothetical protein
LRGHLLQPAIRGRQRDPLVEYPGIDRAALSSGCRRRTIAGAHSPRRYLHIEAVFVFGGRLDHLSAASGQAKRRTRTFIIKEGI